MPAYDYRCPKHGVFEDFAMMKDYQAEMPCPRCGKSCGRAAVHAPNIGLCGTSWIKGNWHNHEFEQSPDLGDAALKAAKRAGVMTTGKRFNHALADHPDDPEAWVGSLDEALETAKRKGLAVKIEDGEVTVKGESHFARKRRLKLEKEGRDRKARLEQGK